MSLDPTLSSKQLKQADRPQQRAIPGFSLSMSGRRMRFKLRKCSLVAKMPVHKGPRVRNVVLHRLESASCNHRFRGSNTNTLVGMVAFPPVSLASNKPTYWCRLSRCASFRCQAPPFLPPELSSSLGQGGWCLHAFWQNMKCNEATWGRIY